MSAELRWTRPLHAMLRHLQVHCQGRALSFSYTPMFNVPVIPTEFIQLHIAVYCAVAVLLSACRCAGALRLCCALLCIYEGCISAAMSPASLAAASPAIFVISWPGHKALLTPCIAFYWSQPSHTDSKELCLALVLCSVAAEVLQPERRFLSCSKY